MQMRVINNGGHRKGLGALALLLSGALTLAACSGSSDDEGSGDGGSDGKQRTSQAKVDEAAAKDSSDAEISISPKDGSDNASINNGTKVTVKNGKLSKVTMVATASGTVVPGTIAADGTSWQPDGQLERATRYSVEAVAKDGEGRKSVSNATFTTVSPENSFIGYFTPEDGSTVGVGMPVSFNFDKGITNKTAVESAIEVNSSSGQEVVGHWFSDTRLDFRPRDYWQGGSEVTVKLKLDGVEGAAGVTGVQQKSFSFTVGRSQVSTVDAETKQMTVMRDGEKLKTIPITSGSAENPTYNGKMVISEKHEETRMNGATVGFTDDDGEGEYDIPDVPHAMRLSTSGTFIHGNYWAGNAFGKVNTSHGCIGLQDVQGADDSSTDGAWFFKNSLLGDVVEVKNSPDKTIQPDNGLNGWNMSWSDWVAGSAT